MEKKIEKESKIAERGRDWSAPLLSLPISISVLGSVSVFLLSFSWSEAKGSSFISSSGGQAKGWHRVEN